MAVLDSTGVLRLTGIPFDMTRRTKKRIRSVGRVTIVDKLKKEERREF